MFTPKADQTAQQALKVQRLTISSKDPSMFKVDSGSVCVLIREPVNRIVTASSLVDATAVLSQHSQSVLSIVDSTAFTAGGDLSAIRISNLASLAANDVVIVEYIVLQS